MRKEAIQHALEAWATDLEQGRQVWIPATTLREAAKALSAPVQQERCHLCDCTGDIHSTDGEWRGECPYCKKPAPDIGNPISTQQ